MPQLKIINTGTQVITLVAASQGGASISLDGASTFSAQILVTIPPTRTWSNTAVNTTTKAVTLANHGYATGTVGQLSGTATLPAGLSTLTDYYIIALTANTFQFASSYANAIAGTFISFTTQGTGLQTFTPNAITGGTAQLQTSNDNSIWNSIGSSQSISGATTLWFEDVNPSARYMRIYFSVTTGNYITSSVFCVKGYN